MNKTKARMMAEEMEEMQAQPGTRSMRKLRGADVSNEGGLGPVRDIVKGVMGGIGNILGPVQNKLMGRERRTDEELDELAREMARGGRKFKSGGSVSSASKRADGCAIKGKTRGRMV